MAEHARALAAAENLCPVEMPEGPHDPVIQDARSVVDYLTRHEDRLADFLGDAAAAAAMVEAFWFVSDGMQSMCFHTLAEWAATANEMHPRLLAFIRHEAARG